MTTRSPTAITSTPGGGFPGSANQGIHLFLGGKYFKKLTPIGRFTNCIRETAIQIGWERNQICRIPETQKRTFWAGIPMKSQPCRTSEDDNSRHRSRCRCIRADAASRLPVEEREMRR